MFNVFRCLACGKTYRSNPLFGVCPECGIRGQIIGCADVRKTAPEFFVISGMLGFIVVFIGYAIFISRIYPLLVHSETRLLGIGFSLGAAVLTFVLAWLAFKHTLLLDHDQGGEE